MSIDDIDSLDSLKKYGSFQEVKKVLEAKFGFDIKSKNWKSLFEKLQSIKNFNPYEEFEKSKIANFKYSSRLEGVDIENTNQSLDEIIKKYKVEIDE